MSNLETKNIRQVLALKYRPRRFEDLIGQDTISTTLSLALDTNRLSHAYLFSGLRGSGKTSTARIMAKALVCENAPTSKPCEVCQGCISANENRHLDIIEMDAASNRGIDDIKELIEHTKYKPTSAKYKIFIIDEVHMLTTQAFNALLKTLEEPPEFVKFILATTDPLKLPATILSRTQHFRFKRIPNKDIVHHLSHILNIENIEFETEALEILTRAGQGSLRDTLTLLDQAIIFSKGIINTVSVTDMLGMIDPSFMEKVFDIILEQKDINPILDELESYEVGQVLDEMSIYLKQQMLVNNSKFGIYIFDRFFRILADSKQLLSMNSDGGFVLILTLSKMKEATAIYEIDDIIEQVEAIETTKTTTSSQQTVVTSTEQKIVQQEESKTIVQQKDSLTTSEKFDKLIKTIYDKNYDLGECFESCFSFVSYENHILTINSTASGDCRVMLYKNLSYIKSYITDIFGIETELEFHKIVPPKEQKDETTLKATVEEGSSKPSVDVEIVAPVVENDAPASCIQSLCEPSNPTLAQKDIDMNEIVNSKMVQTAITLLQPPTQIRIKSKL